MLSASSLPFCLGLNVLDNVLLSVTTRNKGLNELNQEINKQKIDHHICIRPVFTLINIYKIYKTSHGHLS